MKIKNKIAILAPTVALATAMPIVVTACNHDTVSAFTPKSNPFKLTKYTDTSYAVISSDFEFSIAEKYQFSKADSEKKTVIGKIENVSATKGAAITKDHNFDIIYSAGSTPEEQKAIKCSTKLNITTTSALVKGDVITFTLTIQLNKQDVILAKSVLDLKLTYDGE